MGVRHARRSGSNLLSLSLGLTLAGAGLLIAAGAGFALATLGGYLLSVWIGLFGFQEVRTTAGIVPGLIEVAGFAVLAILAAAPAIGAKPTGATAPGSAALARLRAGILGTGLEVSSLSVLALALLGVAVAGANSPASPGESAPSGAPTAQPRQPTTGTRSTPASAIPRQAGQR